MRFSRVLARSCLDDVESLPTFHLREASRRETVGTSMRSRRLRQFLIAGLRGSVVALSLLGYLAASIGFPAPAPSTDHHGHKDDHASPCSGGTCGCSPDAEHCCCSGKTKPAPPPPAKKAPKPKPCCTNEAPCPLCVAVAILFPGSAKASETETVPKCPFCASAAEPPSCCGGQATSLSTETGTAALADETSADPVRWVHGIRARECHGLDVLWYGLAAALPLPPPLRWEGDRQFAGWLTPISPLTQSVSRAPPAPPPRG
jgi:hypothetical protein